MEARDISGTFDPVSVHAFRIGEWLVSPSLNRISNGGSPIQLEPRVMGVLVYLASKPGEVIPRRNLLNTVWADTVVCEEALTRSISRLRRILRDNPTSPRYIETIRKGGYRLVAPVSPADPPDLFVSSERMTITPNENDVSGANMPKRAWRLTLMIFGGMALIATIVLLSTIHPRANDSESPVMLQGTPLTSYPGREGYPSFSPDGNLVAFVWDGEVSDHYDLYVKQRNSDSFLRLTDSATNESYSTWSPDGSTVAFVRGTGKISAIYSVPALGGMERRLLQASDSVVGLDWSPDGQSLVFATADSPGRLARLFRYNFESDAIDPVLTSPTAYQNDTNPAFSPDGRHIAFLRTDPSGTQDIYLVSAGGDEARQLTNLQETFTGLDWAPDSQNIVVSAAPLGNYSLWRISCKDGASTRLLTRSQYAMRPTLPATGEGLIFEEQSYEFDIWCVQLDHKKPSVPRITPLVSSTRPDYGGRYSPDGSKIVFISSRSGDNEVWICESDGTRARQISSFKGVRVSNPRWSPNQRYIACSAIHEGTYTIFLLDPEGGAQRSLYSPTHHARFSSWSRDGEWLYYNSDQDEIWQIWKINVDSRVSIQVTKAGGLWGFESHDGKSLYFAKPGVPGLWNQLILSGEARCILDSVDMSNWASMAIVEHGIYVITDKESSSVLSFYDFQTEKITDITSIPGYVGYHLAVSPDGNSILYDCSERFERDLILVESFR